MSVLDTIILNIEGNSWTTRDACTGTMVFGMTGSGKSSGPLYKIANKFLGLGYGGVVFCAKPDEAETWMKYAKEAKRENDLIFLSKETFNYLEHESKRTGSGGGQIENLVNLYLEICNIGKDKKAGGTNDEYWQNAVKQMLRNSMTVLQMCNEPINIENIYKLIMSAPSPAGGGEVEIKDGYCSDLIDIVTPHEKREKPEYALAKTYFYEEFATLDGRTRSNTISSFTVTADAMQRGELSRCFSAEHSSLNLEDIYKKGKILIVDYDCKSWGRLGQYAASIIKYCFEMMIERREDISQDDARPVFLWADECQFFAIEYDQKFQTTARSSRTLTVYATQNLGNLHDGYGKEKASSLIGNLGTKFFCQNGEFETNEWASKSIGQEIVKRKSQNYGDSKSSNMKGDDNKSFSYSEGFSEQKDYRVDPSDFSTLQTGGPRGQCRVGFIFWQSGRVLNNGSVFVRSTVEQQCRKVCGASRIRHCPKVPEAGKGVYVGEYRIFLPSDIASLTSAGLCFLIPVFGVALIYLEYDRTLYVFNDWLYINYSTICLYFLCLAFDLSVSALVRVPGILKAVLTGQSRQEAKLLKGMIWQDALLGYYIVSLGLTLWLQSSFDSLSNILIVLGVWYAVCLFYCYIRTSGGKEIKQ